MVIVWMQGTVAAAAELAEMTAAAAAASSQPAVLGYYTPAAEHCGAISHPAQLRAGQTVYVQLADQSSAAAAATDFKRDVMPQVTHFLHSPAVRVNLGASVSS